MSIAITWTDNKTNESVSLGINDSAMASLDSYRQSLKAVVRHDDPETGYVSFTEEPKFGTVLEMILDLLSNAVFGPAFSQFPSDEVKTKAEAAAAAKEEFEMARNDFIKSGVMVIAPQVEPQVEQTTE